jgi:hypothetical protein
MIIGILTVYGALASIAVLCLYAIYSAYKSQCESLIENDKLMCIKLVELNAEIKKKNAEKSELEVMLRNKCREALTHYNELEWYRTKLRANYPQAYIDLDLTLRVEVFAGVITNDGQAGTPAATRSMGGMDDMDSDGQGCGEASSYRELDSSCGE